MADRPTQDHGLFQAICRVNRLDGEDKEFGYVVDYKDRSPTSATCVASWPAASRSATPR